MRSGDLASHGGPGARDQTAGETLGRHRVRFDVASVITGAALLCWIVVEMEACCSGHQRVRLITHPLRRLLGYCPSQCFIISSIWALTASRLKEAGACIGG